MRVRTPTILQLDALQCGAVALGIVLAHHGRWVPVEELARACGVSRDGGRAGNLLRAARAHGLVAQGFRAEPAALRRLPLPLVLHWNFSHYVVLEGFGRRGRVYLNDPATGPRTATGEELERCMTGVVLAMEPGPGFQPAGRPPRPLASLRRRAAAARAGLGAVALAGLLLAALEMAAPFFPRALVDRVLAGGEAGLLLPLLAAMAVAAALAGSLTRAQGRALLRRESRHATAGARAFLRHLLRLPVSFFDRNYAAALSERVPLNARVARFLFRDLAVNAVGAAAALCFLLLLARHAPVLALAAVALLAVQGGALWSVARRRADAGARLLQEEMRMNATALLGLRQIETVKASAGEGDLFARWQGYQARVVSARQALTRSTHLLEALPPFLAAASAAAVLGVGGARVAAGELTLGTLVMLQLLMAAFLAPAGRLVALGGRLQTAEIDVRRLDEVLEHPAALPEEAFDEEPAAAAPLRGELELRGVEFGFAPLEPPLVRGVELRVAPGRWVALVGRTGSGKSTVARLAAGLYEPWAGEVLLDGRPRAAHPRAAVTGTVAVVDQEIRLFAGTVRENLSLWDPAVPEERLERAARDACILEEIRARGGWEARVEEGGANWSGGERQRLELARALALDPAVLVLDEATSALDAETEAQVAAGLRRRGCGCLLVAHRLATVRQADEIVVLDGGRVAERGTHPALDRAGGAYRAFLEAE